MPDLLFVEPVFAERVWGGTTLKQWYGRKVPEGVIGECWAVSGLSGQSGLISSGAPQGYTLDRAWAEGLVTGEVREDQFPLLCKILDPMDWLSVQVHPNDEQAQALEGQPQGKAECWYVLECQAGAELILGHSAATAQELAVSLLEGTVMSKVIRHIVEPGSFFMVPAGCVHTLGPGMLVYEVQESSDITYRLYDFDRAGLDGNPRELHIEKGLSVVTAPYDPADSLTAEHRSATEFGTVRVLVDNEHFTVTSWDVVGDAALVSEGYRVMTVVGGSGTVSVAGADHEVRRGTSIVIPSGIGAVAVSGELSFMLTDPGPKHSPGSEGVTRPRGRAE